MKTTAKKGLIIALFVFQLLTINAFSQVEQEWVQRFTSDSVKNESVNDMFVDSDGNVFLTGSQMQTGLNSDIEALTLKYNSLGQLQWIQNYQAIDNNGAFCRAIHVDAQGNVYVTGETAISSGGANQALVIKYSPTGTQLWANTFQYSEFQYCGGYDITTDADGNVYVTGEYYTGVNFLNNIFLIKYDADGNLVNQTFYNSDSEGGRKIALDGAGKIIVGGYVNTNDSLSFIVLKYEQNLDFVWEARWGLNVGNQNPIDMVIDNNSNIIISGTSNLDYATVKFGPAGNLLWGRLYNSSTGWDEGAGVVKDNLGNIYVTGATGTTGFPLSYNMTTIKYSPNGDENWIQEYDSTSTAGYQAADIAIDNDANIYIIGQSTGADIVTIKYNSAGLFQWAINYDGPSASMDIPVAIGVDPGGNVYSTGNSLDTTSGYDIVIIKYVQTPSSVNYKIDQPTLFSLEQNYPNPFTYKTTIAFTLIKESIVNLMIYDVTGKLVRNLSNTHYPSGTYAFEWNGENDFGQKVGKGAYFCKMIVGNESKSIVMVVN